MDQLRANHPSLMARNMDVKPMPRRMIAILSCMFLSSGCSAIHCMRGVPAAYMPPEYMAESREGKSTIDLSLLQRSQSDQYRIEAGDVLAVYAPGLLGLVDTHPDQPRGENPPINNPQNPTDRPSLGFPVTVRDDNTIQIPQLPAIDVYGLTEREVEDRLRQAVLQTGLLAQETQPRLVVSIMRPRTYRVLVCRQESGAAPTPTMSAGLIDIGRAGKGTSRVVDLRAYENDVAHALAQPGVDGLPGLDARNVIYVIRARNARGRGAYCPGGDPQPTPLSHNRHDFSNPRPIIRGQSPSRNWGLPTASGQRQGHSPYAYMTSSQFNLSGSDIAQGSTGPALIEPLPETALASAHHGFGHQTPSHRTNHFNPTYSPRSAAGPTDSRYALSPMAVAVAPGTETPYRAMQYSEPQAPYSQSLPQPATGVPAGPRQAPLSAQSYPARGSLLQARYPSPAPPMQGIPTDHGPVMMAPVEAGQMVADPLPPVWQNTLQDFDPTIQNSQVIKIPVRLAPGEEFNLTEEDITLYDGDIVFIDNRDTDVYFIGGLLGGGQYPLPRDRDLRVLEAVSLAQGQNSSSAGSTGMQSSGGVSALNRDITPSASRLLILRQVGCNQQLTVEVDLYKALRYPHENILVQPRDMLILQYTPCEAVLAFTQRNLFEGALLGIAAGQLTGGSR
jgi:protein involved in polysaccharide export with SLBB domain